MKKDKKRLFLFYGANGAGKTTLARHLATKYSGLHIELDWFSSMHRGKAWHTRKNNKDKMHLLIGTLDAALVKTKYRLFFIDGVLIYPFMFRMLEDWARENGITLHLFKLVGAQKEMEYRVKRRKKKQNWNKKLPAIYKKLTYKGSVEIPTTGKTLLEVSRTVSESI